MKRLMYLATALMAIVAPAVTEAQYFDINDYVCGTYAGLSAGGNWDHYCRHEADFRPETGYIVSGAAGIEMPYSIRLEGEVAYRRNCLDKVEATVVGYEYDEKYGKEIVCSMSGHFTGHLSSLSYMANALYDFEEFYNIQPYAGLGIGYSRNYRTEYLHFGYNRVKYVSHKNGFAWQGIGGFAIPLEKLSSCGWDIKGIVEYRYFNPNKRHLHDHSLLIGLRVAL